MSCRKKIDSKLWLDYTQTMETEVRTLKQELTRTREALKIATKRCRDLVRELDSRTVGHETERCLRDQQLSRILRALLVLESRLKQEQKSIRQLLCEKDNVIRNQQLEIAKLRRYTKNYIKCNKREHTRNSENPLSSVPDAKMAESAGCYENEDNVTRLGESLARNGDSCYGDANEDACDEIGNELGNDIQRLKHEIIDKLSAKNRSRVDDHVSDVERNDEDVETRKSCRANRQSTDHDRTNNRCVRKTDSFAGSDVSKESCASSSENTDAISILTTTTDESSPSLISTEGFCEGESTDCSPGSTLNKSKTSVDDVVTRNVRNGTTRVATIARTSERTNDHVTEQDERRADGNVSKRRYGAKRNEPQDPFFKDEKLNGNTATITRTESKDDGMDCNYASEDENLEDAHEPIYVNAFSTERNNAKNRGESPPASLSSNAKLERGTVAAGKNAEEYCFDNNNGSSKLDGEPEASVDDTSGNWYSDPDEDRTSDEVFRQSCYRPSRVGNHNSVLECVNQILLRDMEEEESALTAPRRFKHRGRIVRFQPARLSDIESVGSEMERRNSEDCPNEIDETKEREIGNFEATASEDEFGMRYGENEETRRETSRETETGTSSTDESAAIPILVIEPKNDRETSARRSIDSMSARSRAINGSTSPTLRMERIEEKTCIRMSTKGLTIAKNLDYEDIESLPDVSLVTMPKTPPALPPKPTQFRNTLVLKKIPSPSFLIDETGRKRSYQRRIEIETRGLIPDCLVGGSTKGTSVCQTARSLVYEERYTGARSVETGNATARTTGHQSNDVTTRVNSSAENLSPRVTNIVRHFEEFKIGGDADETRNSSSRTNHHRNQSRTKERGRGNVPDLDHHLDIRQNFEEFNLDECDLSDDPDRPEADGSERLVNLAICQIANDERNNTDNNNHLVYPSSRPTSGILSSNNNGNNGIYDNFLEATGLSNKSILTPSRLLSNHKSMLKPKDVKYKNRIKSNAVMEKNSSQQTGSGHLTQVRHWTGPFV